MNGKRTKSGVFVFDDFRDNLIIDRYDPIFGTMRGQKISALGSENSEDALTWNVFRSLRQINALFWLPALFERSRFKSGMKNQPKLVSVKLWQRIRPPPILRPDEGDSEIDVLIETESVVWFIEAKHKSDISTRTTNREERDQVTRNIDVGSWYAGVRDFYFALLIWDEKYSPIGTSLVYEFASPQSQLIQMLPHRPDRLVNVKGIGLLRWSDLAAILSDCARTATREDERQVAKRAVEWWGSKNQNKK